MAGLEDEYAKCWFVVYDNESNGIAVPVYNLTFNASAADMQGSMEWHDTCQVLRDVCLQQRNDTDEWLSTNLKCAWIEKDSECVCWM